MNLLMPTVPVLTTERLTLRGHRLSDLDALVALWADPAVIRYIGGRPFTREETWVRLLRNVGHWALLGYGSWIVEETETGRFVGDVGLGDFRRDLDPPIGSAPEAGWVLSPWAAGRGYATEAVRAVVGWGEAHLGAETTQAIIDEGNVASLRVAEKCGFALRAHVTYKGQPALLLERRAA